jgi:hypothetical protein
MKASKKEEQEEGAPLLGRALVGTYAAFLKRRVRHGAVSTGPAMISAARTLHGPLDRLGPGTADWCVLRDGGDRVRQNE